MARKQSSRNTSILPLTLPGYPSCENCLAWSGDGLAVACGENICMLTFAPTGLNLTNAASSQARVHTVRVNLFDTQEWPPDEISSCSDLSLGEEQSDSIVVGIAWSPSGLGIYRRSVLTVLTSNLRLCLWETDGTPRSWRRTCVLNHFIQTERAATRRENRIRCFAWTPTLHIAENDRWGTHLLVVADDSNTLHMYRVSKHNRLILGDWQVQQVWQHNLSTDNAGQPLKDGLTALQHLLTAERTIAKIEVGSWEPSDDGSVYRATIQCEWSYSMPPIVLEVGLKAADIVIHQNVIQTQSELLLLKCRLKPPLTSNHIEIPRVLHRLESLPSWKKSLQETCQKYDHQHNLNGRYRVRLWGTSRHSNLKALCFTLHPSDLYEYTTAVIQKCRIVFQTTDAVRNDEATSDPASEEVIRDDILSVGLQLSTGSEMTMIEMDKMIIQNFKSIAACRKGKGKKQKVTPAAGQRLSEVVLEAAAEVCGLCQAKIPLTTDLSSATCAQGHRYSRCNLSTLAIQEPGMSKYCSTCDREYLEHGRLNLPPEQCLTRILFDTFDVCPFCDGKYRN